MQQQQSHNNNAITEPYATCILLYSQRILFVKIAIFDSVVPTQMRLSLALSLSLALGSESENTRLQMPGTGPRVQNSSLVCSIFVSLNIHDVPRARGAQTQSITRAATS